MKGKLFYIILTLIFISVIATLFVYQFLPQTIPTHWNIKGEVDDYGTRSTVFITMLLPLVFLIMFDVLPKIDPKRENYKKHSKAYKAIQYSAIVFFILIHWITILVSLGFEVNINLIIPALIGVLFVIMGNYMTQIRHNYFVGIRLPWTLANEFVWKKTHRLGGILFTILGLSTILSSFISSYLTFYVLIIGAFGSIIITSVYSYIIYNKIDKN
jgi:uncharacterized membrane protein